MRGICLLACFLMTTALVQGAEPAPTAAATPLDAVVTLIEQLRYDDALQALQVVAETNGSLNDKLRQQDLRADIYRQQGKWAAAEEAQASLNKLLQSYTESKPHDLNFANALRQRILIRQALILLQGRNASYFLLPGHLLAEDEIAVNRDLVTRAASSIRGALDIPLGMRTTDQLWELQQRLWLAALRRHLDPKATETAEFQTILTAGLRLLSADVEKLPIAELCYAAARTLEPAQSAPLADRLKALQATASAVEKLPLLLVLVDTLFWQKDLDTAGELLIAEWNAGHEASRLSPAEILELGLRLVQTHARELPKVQPAWRPTMVQALSATLQDQAPDWLVRNARLIPVLESLVLECEDSPEVTTLCAANLLRLKKLLWSEGSLPVADAYALHAGLLAQQSKYRDKRSQAIRDYNAALSVWQALPQTERRQLHIAEAQNTLAGLYLENRESGQVASLLDAAEKVFLAQTIRDLRLAQLENNRGYLLNLQGNTQSAIEHYQSAEKLCRQSLADDPQNSATVRLLGAILLNQIQGLKSSNHLAQAAKRCEECAQNSLLQKETQDVCRVWSAMFNLELMNSGPKQNDSLAQRAEQYRNLIKSLAPLATQDQTRQAAEANYTAALCHYHLFVENNKDDAAIDQLQHALEKCQTTHKLAQQQQIELLELRSLQLLGKIYLQLSVRKNVDPRLLSAASMSDAQLARIEELSGFLQATPIVHYQALDTAARILRNNRSDRAVQVLEQALAAIESRRSFGMLSAKERAENFARFAGGFDQLVDWYCEDAATHGATALEQAIFCSDRKRSRTFLDQLCPLRSPKDARMAGEHANLQQTSERLLADDSLNHTEYSAQLQSEFQDLERVVSDMLHETDNVSLPGSMTKLTKTTRPTQICYYHLGRKHSYLFHIVAVPNKPLAITVTPLQITAEQAARIRLNLLGQTTTNKEERAVSGAPKRSKFPLDLTETVACGLSNALLEQMQHPASNSPRLDYEQRLAIAEVLLPPAVRDAIRQQPASLLLWVPDGPLHRVPLDALTFGRNKKGEEQYLLDDLKFPPSQYTPSLAIFQQLASAPRTAFPDTVLSLSNPDYKRGKMLDGANKPLTELPQTAREQQSLQALFAQHPDKAKNFFSRGTASEENFRTYAPNAKLIHLAAHAFASERYDQLAGCVYLAPPLAGSTSPNQDGQLTLNELREISFAECELAILAACQTNVGLQLPLEAGSTIARTFLEKGARRVLCSQWELPDLATADLLCEFIPRLAGPVDDSKDPAQRDSPPFYAAELLRAKRAIRAKFPDPHQWAPLVLIGCD
ncbi:MAG: CHAT domain-containing protein [Planctomycetota bacterium]|nr:CHAT domain-containing protein [Planctomycetota bacterium]